jgi:hypothetical protein
MPKFEISAKRWSCKWCAKSWVEMVAQERFLMVATTNLAVPS